jgi:hypothetical protein
MIIIVLNFNIDFNFSFNENVKGSKLNVNDEEKAETWIIDNKPDFLPAFLAFKAKDKTFFPSSIFHDSILKTYKNKPGLWWNLMSSRTAARLPPELCSYFSSLLSVPPSSALLEIIFLPLV